MNPNRLEPELMRAIAMTRIIRHPRQTLSTFGSTVVDYHVVSQPIYEGLFDDQPSESVIRHGVVKADKPKIVTPGFLRSEGFGREASEYLDYLINNFGSNAPGLLYKYRNEPGSTDTVSGEPAQVAAKIRDELNRKELALHAVILGVDELWDVSLIKFIYELTSASSEANFNELSNRGLIQDDGGVPHEVRLQIDDMFARAQRGTLDPSDIHDELVRWGIFEEYQQRFFSLFRRDG